MQSRWIEIKKTTPSGKVLFVCMSCGAQTPAPTEECVSLVRMQYRNTEILMPCAAWPLTPDEYVERKTMSEQLGSYFSGTVLLADGKIIEVSAPIPDEIANEIAIVSVEHQLSLDRVRAKLAAKVAAKEEEVQQQMLTMQQQADADSSFNPGPLGYVPVVRTDVVAARRLLAVQQKMRSGMSEGEAQLAQAEAAQAKQNEIIGKWHEKGS